MPREPGGSARLLPRLARLLIGRNGLRRPSDRIEGGLVVMLAAVFLAVVVVTSLVAAQVYRSQRAAVARLHPAVAVLSRSGPSDILTGYGQVSARWRAPDGRPRSGRLTTDTAPGIWNAAAGARVRVWVTSTGQPAAPPPGQPAMILSALLVPFWGAGMAAVVLVICYWLGRLVLDRRRLASWESAWALTGPRWTSLR